MGKENKNNKGLNFLKKCEEKKANNLPNETDESDEIDEEISKKYKNWEWLQENGLLR